MCEFNSVYSFLPGLQFNRPSVNVMHMDVESNINIHTAPTTLKLASTSLDMDSFINSLGGIDFLNDANTQRSFLLDKLIENSVPTTKMETSLWSEDSDSNNAKHIRNHALSMENPGRWESMKTVAPGAWRVIYAPHMTTMAKIAGGGTFKVDYILNKDGSMESHARLSFPWFLGLRSVWLSVSGTYGSVNDKVCKVNFDEAWIRLIPNKADELVNDEPYGHLEDVPNSPIKTAITKIGRSFFIEDFSVFPISFLDDDVIVFEFEALGTRICAHKLAV